MGNWVLHGGKLTSEMLVYLFDSGSMWPWIPESATRPPESSIVLKPICGNLVPAFWQSSCSCYLPPVHHFSREIYLGPIRRDDLGMSMQLEITFGLSKADGLEEMIAWWQTSVFGPLLYCRTMLLLCLYDCLVARGLRWNRGKKLLIWKCQCRKQCERQRHKTVLIWLK